MATSQCNAHSESAKIDQVITEFFAKSLHIILDARSPRLSSGSYCDGDLSTSSPSSSTSRIQRRDKWFNLALRECPAALQNLEPRRQSNLDPLVVDVILTRRRPDSELVRPGGCFLRNLSAKEAYPNCWNPVHDEFVGIGKSEKILERWIVQYESKNGDVIRKGSKIESKKCEGRGRSHSSVMSAAHKTYKGSIVLLRSLYATTRLLPTYKFFRDLESSSQICFLKLTHRISSFTEPFTRSEDAEMKQFDFVPVDTPCGRLCVSVSYLQTLDIARSEPSTPSSVNLLPDYVGSPLADPVRRLQSLPITNAFAPYSRHHGRSLGDRATTSMPSSPSPACSNSHFLQKDHFVPPNADVKIEASPAAASSLLNAPITHGNTSCRDEYRSSPPCSPPSPSHSGFLSHNSSCILLPTETFPARIHLCHGGEFPNQFLPPSWPKGMRPRNPSPEGNTKKQLERLRIKDVPTHMNLRKAVSSVKDDRGHLTRMGMPRVSGFSSRLPLLDGRDSSDVAFPFAMDADIRADEPSGGKEHVTEALESVRSLPICRSQDAVLGDLVQILKTSLPLRSSFERTVGDALEKLRSYKEMKLLLIKKGRIRSTKETQQQENFLIGIHDSI